MTYPLWPTDIACQVEKDTFSMGTRDGRLKTPFDRGPSSYRKVTSRAPTPVSVTAPVTSNQKARFLRFWEEDLLGGVYPCVMPDWALNGLRLKNEQGLLLMSEGLPLAMTSYWVAQIVSYELGRNQLSMNLEVMAQ